MKVVKSHYKNCDNCYKIFCKYSEIPIKRDDKTLLTLYFCSCYCCLRYVHKVFIKKYYEQKTLKGDQNYIENENTYKIISEVNNESPIQEVKPPSKKKDLSNSFMFD